MEGGKGTVDRDVELESSDATGSKKSGNGRVRVVVCRVRAGPGISGTRSGT